MQRRGHPVAGAIAGFLFFGFVGVWLMLFGVIPLEGPWLALAPVGLVLGAIWGAWAPIGRKRPKPTTFVPTIPLGEPVGRTWTVRPVTGEQPVTPAAATGEVPATTPVPLRPVEPAPPDEPSGPSEWAERPDEGTPPTGTPSPWAPDPPG